MEESLVQKAVKLCDQLARNNFETRGVQVEDLAGINIILKQLQALFEIKSSTHPIHALPLELLLAIFQQAAVVDKSIPLKLLLVSKSWRDIASSTPNLWTNIILDDEKPDFLEHAYIHLLFSKGAEISVSVVHGRDRVIPALEFLLQGHLDRIVEFDWSSAHSWVSHERIEDLLYQMKRLRVIRVDYTDHRLVENFDVRDTLQQISATVASNLQINQILEKGAFTQRLTSLELFIGWSFTYEESLQTALLHSMPLKTFKISVHVRHPVKTNLGFWFKDATQMKYLRTLELLGTTIITPLLDTVNTRREKNDPVTSPIETLTLAADKLVVSTCALIIGACGSLTNLTLACDAEPRIIEELLRGLQDASSLKTLIWTGLKLLERVEGPDDDIPIAFLHLTYLGYEPANEVHISIFSRISAPILEELHLDGGRKHGGPLWIRNRTTLDLFLGFLLRTPLLHTLKTEAISWYSATPITLPYLNKLSVHIRTLGIPRVNSLTNPSLNLEISAGRANFKVSDIPGDFLKHISRLSVRIQGVFRNPNSIGPMEVVLPRLVNIRVIHFPNEDLDPPHIDRLCQLLLSNPDICPNIEEIHSPQYADWHLLLKFIMSRNIMRSLHPDMTGPTRIKILSFPRQLHVDIFTLIRDALLGLVVAEVPPWTLPPVLYVFDYWYFVRAVANPTKTIQPM